MRERWFADDRDLIKWAVLTHLADRNALKTIVQIPYWRPETKRCRPHFRFLNNSLPVSDKVWRFFKDIKSVERLGGPGTEIKVFVEEFNPRDRGVYSQKITDYLQGCARPLLLFLDPDTGLEPKMATGAHVTRNDVSHAWAGLTLNDWLVLYQHARRHKGWIANVSREIREICEGASLEVAQSEDIGRDVALICVRKT